MVNLLLLFLLLIFPFSVFAGFRPTINGVDVSILGAAFSRVSTPTSSALSLKVGGAHASAAPVGFASGYNTAVGLSKAAPFASMPGALPVGKYSSVSGFAYVARVAAPSTSFGSQPFQAFTPFNGLAVAGSVVSLMGKANALGLALTAASMIGEYLAKDHLVQDSASPSGISRKTPSASDSACNALYKIQGFANNSDYSDIGSSSTIADPSCSSGYLQECSYHWSPYGGQNAMYGRTCMTASPPLLTPLTPQQARDALTAPLASQVAPLVSEIHNADPSGDSDPEATSDVPELSLPTDGNPDYAPDPSLTFNPDGSISTSPAPSTNSLSDGSVVTTQPTSTIKQTAPDTLTQTDTVKRTTVHPDGTVTVDESPSPFVTGTPTTVPSGTPTTVPSGTPTTVPSGTPTTPEVEPDLCVLHPDILACAKFGVIPVPELMPVVPVPIALNPTSLGEGVCPSPVQVVLSRMTYTQTYQPYCDFSTSIKPFLLAFSWLSAGFFVVSGI